MRATVLLFVLIFLVSACSKPVDPLPNTSSSSSSSSSSDVAKKPEEAPSEPPKKVVEPEKKEPSTSIPGFDPVAVCAGALDPLSIPSVPVRGHFAKHQKEDLSLDFALVSGRVEVRKDGRATLRMASEELKECSPFLESGEIAKKPRVSVALGSLEKRTYAFPDNTKTDFRFWNYIYTTEKGTPFTLTGISNRDTGVVVIDEIDKDQKVVTGRVLLCRQKGKIGWAAGRFELPLCEK